MNLGMNHQHTIKNRVHRSFALTFIFGIFAWSASFNLLLSQETATVVEDQTEMLFFKGTEPPQADWRMPEAVMDGWTAAKVPVGYGESFVTEPDWTVIEDMRNNYATLYIRIPFELPAGRRFDALNLSARFDDGFVAYINGVELGRASMPDGDVNFETFADSHEHSDDRADLDADDEVLNALKAGRNILAVEAHNTSIGSSDMIFDPELTIDISGPIGPLFIRGADCDGQPRLNINDLVYLLQWKFGNFTEPGCQKACDLNDDGTADISDAVTGLEYLFLVGPALPAPFPEVGPDLTEDDLTCVSGEQED